MTNFRLQIILSDVRSSHNVGSILRTADAAGVEQIYACGYTPYPRTTGDARPPHVIWSNHQAIAKTALGAENSMSVRHTPDALTAISEAKRGGFKIIMIEQSEKSLNLYHYRPVGPIALVLGNEVDGLSAAILSTADAILEIPMLGMKESLNVSVAGALAMYQLRFGC